MILPPLVIDVRAHEEGQRSFRIWFPFVILWPLLFLIVGLLAVITILIDLALALAGAKYHDYTMLLVGTLKLLAEARGTHAHIDSKTSLVTVHII